MLKPNSNHSEVEHIKDRSDYLRGYLQESLQHEITGSVHNDDTQVIKFHGSYQQTDRDLESERKLQKLEPLYSFMIRIRLAGGVIAPKQWIKLDNLSYKYGSNTLKITTRQAIQLHGITKINLKKTIAGFNEVLLDSIAGCGDVNRNVMCNPNPYQSMIHDQILLDAQAISAHLTPKTSAYWEVWLQDQENDSNSPLINKGKIEDSEPIYSRLYLPRKFKIALAIPPNNDIDLFANDIGLIAISENENLIGYNIIIGGGLGMTFGMDKTYPRLGDSLGFVKKEYVIDICEKIVTIQRDWGNREDRKFSRLKYTIDKFGLDVFLAELKHRCNYAIEKEKPFHFESNGDEFGWTTNFDGTVNFTLFVEGGRVKDSENKLLKTALREIAEIHDGDFRLTGNQNIIITKISSSQKNSIIGILQKYKIVTDFSSISGLRLNSLACVALNTCSLAFAEAERYLPKLIDKIDLILKEFELEKEPIIIRMTGCPNGCARPYLGEIGLVGRSLGKYNLYLGASHSGDRLNKLYKELLDEDQIIATLRPIFKDYATKRLPQEYFGDFTIRMNYVKATTQGLNFHA